MANQQTSDADQQLFDVKNAFYVGNYQQSINFAEKIKKPILEKDILMFRSYLATNRFRVVLDEISPNSSSDLLAVRIFADYLLNKNKFDDLIQIMEKKIESSEVEDLHVIWRVMTAIMYVHENQLEDALRILNSVNDLECLAIQVYIYLRMSRLDLAKKVLTAMSEKNDDDTLTQLAQAWLNIEVAGDKLQDAFYILDDFNDKFTSSILLLNNMAVCALGQQKFDDAQTYLRDGLDREPNNYDLLVNFIFYSQQTDKNAEVVINRYLSLLKETCKNGELVEELVKKESEFDRLCQNYTFKEADKITS